MADALIGYTGFVGSALLKQRSFDKQYRSTNIHEIAGEQFDMAVCAGAPAQKWIANKEPANDLKNIERLMEHLRQVSCKHFILISTVDVFKEPVEVDESSVVEETGLHPYGLHRYYLEQMVMKHFPKHLVVRLPGLVGPGLRKNALFDLLNGNNLEALDSRAVFQFYPMINLWPDIELACSIGLSLLHLTAGPISLAEAAARGFSKAFTHQRDGIAARYDMRSRHAIQFGGVGHYQYSQRESLLAIRAYAQSEPRTLQDA